MFCYRHPDRSAGVLCQRCEKPICPSCMVQASVGFHCPACVQGHTTKVYTLNNLRTTSSALCTKILLIINVLVYILSNVTEKSSSVSDGWLIEKGILYAADKVEGTAQYVNNAWVVLSQQPTSGVAGGEWWRLVTSGFLHGSVLHLLFNMFVLWKIGSFLEQEIGKTRFISLYFGSLLAGSLGVLLTTPQSPTLGASGAIFGLMGAAYIWQRYRHYDLRNSGLGGLIVMNVVFTFAVPGISVGGHIGGLLGGLLLGFLAVQTDKVSHSKAVFIVVSALLSTLFIVASFYAASHWNEPLLPL